MDEYLGIVKLFAGNFIPRGWSRCDGTLLPINQNAALFSILGTQFGGDGITTFALPDLRKTAPLPNLTYIICLEGVFPSRN
jgi:microcystin-dependent protein